MPQLENGFTQIANEILEDLANTKLNGTQFRILLIVWRSTYGWNRKEHDLSLSYLSKATGIHKQQIKKALDSLIEMNIILVVKEHTDTVSRVLEFNKNYVKEVQSTKKSTVSQLGYPTVSQSTDPTVSQLGDQKIQLNTTKEILSFYDKLERLPKYTKLTDKRTKSIKARIKEYGIEEVKIILNKANDSKFLADSLKGKQSWYKFDWIWNVNNFIKISEGNYSEKEVKKPMKKITGVMMGTLNDMGGK